MCIYNRADLILISLSFRNFLNLTSFRRVAMSQQNKIELILSSQLLVYYLLAISLE